MEFADVIRVARCERVTLHQPHLPRTEATLAITSHHLLLAPAQGEELWVLHSNLDHVERRPTGTSGGSLHLLCKDLRRLQLDITGGDTFSKVADTLEDLSRVDEPQLQQPFFYQPATPLLEDGWAAFRPETELVRLLQPGDGWRVSHVNAGYKVCPSYPSLVLVPRTIDDAEVAAAAQHRQDGRFPVMAYRHLPTGAVLVRSGQPHTGSGSGYSGGVGGVGSVGGAGGAVRRCREDEKLLACILGRDKRGYIVDTRTQHVATTAKLRGGGGVSQEGELHYPNWRRLSKPIDRRHTLLESLAKLMEGVNDAGSSLDKWLSRVEASGWMANIRDTLDCACLVAQCLNQEGASVLVHDTSGQDATLQVCALAQIILHPDCRTVRGFEALLEREWIQAGHPFSSRHSRSCYSPPTHRHRHNSPSFLLFLDCVHQIHQQFACSFEFNEEFLVMLFEHAYSSQFGTFMGDCERDKTALGIKTRTTSLWSHVNSPDVLPCYLNAVYQPNPAVIWPSVAPVSLVIWRRVYLRWVLDLSPVAEASRFVTAVREQHGQARADVVRLRRALQTLEQQALKAGLLQQTS